MKKEKKIKEPKPKKEKLTEFEKCKTYRVADNPIEYINRLKQYGHSFVVSSTGRTWKVKEGNRSYLFTNSGSIQYSEMQLYRELRTHVAENIKDLTIPNYTSRNIQYNNFNDLIYSLKDGETLEACGFDLVKAYYKEAYNQNYLSEEFYQRCLALPKETRLRLLGSIATKKRIQEYVNGVPVGVPIVIENQELRKAWFNIAHNVSVCMKEFAALAGDNFLFYWVDGMYLKGKQEDYLDIISKLESKYRQIFKYEPIDKIQCLVTDKGAYKLNIYKPNLEIINKKTGAIRHYKHFCVPRYTDIYADVVFADEPPKVVRTRTGEIAKKLTMEELIDQEDIYNNIEFGSESEHVNEYELEDFE